MAQKSFERDRSGDYDEKSEVIKTALLEFFKNSPKFLNRNAILDALRQYPPDFVGRVLDELAEKKEIEQAGSFTNPFYRKKITE